MNASEVAILAAITDTEKIEVLAEEGLSIEHVPTEELRVIIEWAMAYYFDSGRTQAPSREAMEEEWGSYIGVHGIELPEEDVEVDTPQWAVGMLKANFVQTKANQFQMDLARDMGGADPQDRLKVLSQHADELGRLALSMVPHRVAVESREGLQDALVRYRERVESPGLRGMLLGLTSIDEYLGGIHPSELAVVAAGPKTGKSYKCLHVAKREQERGRCATLFTLEMSVDETYDRMACYSLGLDHSKFLRGELSPEDVKRIEEYVHDVLQSTTLGTLHVIKPEPGERTPESLLRMARMRDTESLIIDQLTFMEHPSEGKKKRDEVIREKMHDLKNGLSVGRYEMACLLAHQINREGVKVAAKNKGWLSMEYLAEGAEVERTADLVFGLYASETERAAQMMKFQMLAARRLVPKNWHLAWRIQAGSIRVLRELPEPVYE